MQININNLSKVFQTPDTTVPALDDLNLSITPGEFVCLLGPSGCGKSTLLNIIAGFTPPTMGQIFINDNPNIIENPGPDRGMVFQHYALFPWMTVEENILFGLENLKKPADTRDTILRHLLKQMHLEEFRKRYPKDLSGGMQQRVAIARVLAIDSPILLMDEPFGALDALTSRTLQSDMVQIWQESKKTVIFVTHNIEEALFLASRIIVLTYRPGTIKADIPVTLERPRDTTSPEFNVLKRHISDLVMAEQARYFSDEIKGKT